MGLGPYPELSLADARLAAAQARQRLREGADPLAERDAARARLKAEQSRRKTFKDCALELIAAKAPGWKNAKHEYQWTATLETYAYPELGHMDAATVEAADVLRVLKPIWTRAPETASRLRGRVEAVLDYAATIGARPKGHNPATWKGNLSLALPSRGSLGRTNHAALPYSVVGEFYQRLASLPGVAATCLRFAMLTAARSGEARSASWEEVDLKAATWTVPADRMKGKREHRVQLSREAVALLKALPKREGIIFSNEAGSPLSDMALTTCIRRLDRTQQSTDEPKKWYDPKLDRLTTAHGTARATFKTWAAECTNFPPAVSEACLAHISGDKVEQAYLRGEFTKQRAALLEAWAVFLTHKLQVDNVVSLSGKRGKA
jgi:integrase